MSKYCLGIRKARYALLCYVIYILHMVFLIRSRPVNVFVFLIPGLLGVSSDPINTGASTTTQTAADGNRPRIISTIEPLTLRGSENEALV